MSLSWFSPDKNISEDVSKERGPVSHGALTTETASTCLFNCENPGKSGHYEDSSVFSASSSSPGLMSVNDGLQYDSGRRQGSAASHGALLFSLGISIGMISSFLASKPEVNKLNELLKQAANLVQDLQEELEMKDSLTVKELVLEDFETQDMYNDSYNKLEAELERLELNTNSSSLERKLSDLFESLRQHSWGELRANVLTRKAGPQPHVDQDVSGNSTTHSPNYAVSPTELSLQLHEVLQSRLEESVKELETELQNRGRFITLNPRALNLADISQTVDQLPPLSKNSLDTLWMGGAHYMPSHLIGNGSASTSSIHHKGEDCNTPSDDIFTSRGENADGEMEKLLIKQILEKAKARKGFPAVINAQRGRRHYIGVLILLCPLYEFTSLLLARQTTIPSKMRCNTKLTFAGQTEAKPIKMRCNTKLRSKQACGNC
ncbi:hypothetical protein LguiA_009647 [Lonicera macranthoides]